MDIVILAGGKCDPEMKAASGVDHRAEIKVCGQRLVDIVLEAVRPLGEPILVGGPPIQNTLQVPAGDNFCDSLANGLGAASSDNILIVTVDLPCLTSDGLRKFLVDCNPNAGFNFPIIAKAACDAAFPGMKRTTLKLREGEFTGGNVALVHRATLNRALPILKRAYELRKKPLRLAGLVGYTTLIKVILGQIFPKSLPLTTLEAGVGRFLGTKVHAVQSESAELGADLDRSEHLRAFESLMKLK